MDRFTSASSGDEITVFSVGIEASSLIFKYDEAALI